MLASRVAQERNGRLGEEVGYQIRFENVVSKRTRIRFVTEGILLRQLIQAEAAKRGLGGITGVGRGSDNPPRLVKLVYEPPSPRGTVRCC